ncbi:MAG: ribonuclease HII [Patescibacteria group bacterium]|nr:ribonuclease HII [Patescibacteria group bacterium]
MRFVIGIDEVGRGALAGPVVVAAVLLPEKYFPRAAKSQNLPKLQDSKKLTKKGRESWAAYIKNNPRINFSLARVYPGKIDKINISRAANLAATNALMRLLRDFAYLDDRRDKQSIKVFLDGGLYVFEEKILETEGDFRNIKFKTAIKGDEKYTSVKLASIIAKVHRDKYLTKLKNKHPDFSFDIHKGYGTKNHIKEIKKFGTCDVHRKSFTHLSLKLRNDNKNR